jgi:hypothetical protein
VLSFAVFSPGTRARAASRCVSSVALAIAPALAFADFNMQTEASVGASDNINHGTELELQRHETIHLIGTEFVYDKLTNRTLTNFGGNFQYYRYLHDTYEDELLGGGTLLFTGAVVPDRFLWQVTDNYGHQVIDTLQTITPGNRQSVNVFRTGPDIIVPLGARTEMDVTLRHSTADFEETLTDNDRNSGQLLFSRFHNERWTTSFGVSSDAIRFEEVEGVDFDSNAVFWNVEATGARTNLLLSIGWNELEYARPGAEPADGLRWGVAIGRQLGGPGALSLRLGRNFSDSGDIFRFGQDNIDVAETQDIVATPDPFENTFGFLSYLRTTPIAVMALVGFWRDSDYQNLNQFDRNERGLRVAWRRSLQDRWSVDFHGTYIRRDLEGLEAGDDTQNWALEFRRFVGRKLGVGFRSELILREPREVPVPLEREENRFFVFFTYGRQRTDLTRAPVFEDR